ncbi:MAG: DUF2079 domain-containing protein, partial [Acidobacteria bacterium]|nr:DUF2079 domain-containing protein [Acidobacteriota bacterium]
MRVDGRDDASRALRTAALTVVVGASVGAFGFLVSHPLDTFGHFTRNALPADLRANLLWSMAAGVLLAAAFVGFRQRRSGDGGRAIRRAAPLAVVGLLPPLLDPRVWSGHELTVLVLVPLFGWGLYAGLRTRQAAAIDQAAPEGGPLTRFVGIPHLPLILVLLGVAGYALYFSHHTLRNHYRFGTSSFDLGLEDNLVWNAAHGAPLFTSTPFGGPGATHAGNHQTYFAYAIAPLYRLFPGPETLLVLQALLMGAAAIPLFFIARRALGPWTAALIAFLYLLSPPLHGAALYDFHYLPLGTLFLWAAWSAAESDRWRWLGVFLFLAATVREDVSAMMAMLGVMMVVEGRPCPGRGRRVRAGLAMLAVGSLVFGVLKFVVMPAYTSGQQSFLAQYQDLVPREGGGYPAVLATVAGNPFFTLGTLLERDKLVYLLQILGPLLFFPLRRATGLLACVAGVLFTLLATRYPPLVQISFQYTTYWTTFLFLAVVKNLEWVRENENPGVARAWLGAITATLLLSSLQYGAVLDTRNARGGFDAYRFGPLTPEDHERHRQAYALLAAIPPEASVVASERLVPHVSSRAFAYTLRLGTYDAEYAVFELPARDDEWQTIWPRLLDGTFGVVDIQGPFVLARRGHDPRLNFKVLRLAGGA